MTITEHGPKCDVGGEYILMPALGFGEMHTFEMHCFPGQKLHTCDEHKVMLERCAESKNLDDLPEGPIRTALLAAVEAGGVIVGAE